MLIHCLKNEVDHALLSVSPSLFSPIVASFTAIQGEVSSPFLGPEFIPLLQEVMSFPSDSELLRQTDRYIREQQLNIICMARYYLKKLYIHIWS
jgi:hypothetical protein